MLNKSGESGHPCLVPDLRANAFSFSPWCLLWIFHIWTLLCWKWAYFLYTHFLESFYHKWVLNFVKSFFWIYWDDHMVFILQYVNMVYHIDWFVYIEESLHTWVNLTWSWCMILLMCCWILFGRILLRIFASIFISDIGL